MEYRKDTIIGDITIYEVYEGKPHEIIELIEGMREKKCIEYDQENAIEFISNKLNISYDQKGLILDILDAEEDYMRSIGIIID